MILILSSSLYSIDPQVDLLVETLKKQCVDFILVNPLSHESIKDIKISLVDGDFEFSYKNKIIDIDGVYVARQIRSDCIISFPENCECTSLYRQKIEDFIFDLCTVFSKKDWFPGKVSSIREGDSKLHIYKLASNLGIRIPDFTINSFERPSFGSYRKVLGYPFSISFSSEDKEEIAITLLNEKEDGLDTYGLPWQWQSYIIPIAQIRCICVGNKIWTFRADQKQFGNKSLREVQETKDIVWERCSLPENERDSLLRLLQATKLSFACPEFIIDEDGKYNFIDLNPCGDWYGFGSEEESLEIATEITQNLRA